MNLSKINSGVRGREQNMIIRPGPFGRIKVLLTCSLLTALAALYASQAYSAISENFNSRKGVSTKTLKGFLQKGCWTFRNFDVNTDGWNPRIEGDGAMVSGAAADYLNTAGIFTPVLDVRDRLNISFKYMFSHTAARLVGRWITISLADANNQPLELLDSFVCKRATDAYQAYHKNFTIRYPGKYRLVLQYHGEGGETRIGIDELVVSASPAYAGGCNAAPRAKDDRITGHSNRYATGSLFDNDEDLNRERVKGYVIKPSPAGRVVINDDGSFLFTPHKDFTGDKTSFTYKICEDGAGMLCSEDATVWIDFPEEDKKAEGMTEFLGAYKLNGNVELRWTTDAEKNLDYFELERSLDGKEWQSSGTVKAIGLPDKGHEYSYIDRVSRNTANRKDLYYRLKQIATDGNVAFSRLLVARVYNTRTLTMISVTPNPVQNDISVNVQLQEPSFITMRVVDTSGVLAIKETIRADKGANSYIISGSNGLSPGLYMLEVIVNSKETMLVKLLKE